MAKLAGPSSARRRAVVAAAGLVAVASGVAGCGGTSSNGESAKTAAQILTDAKAATSSLTSVHLTEVLTENGGTTRVDVDAGVKAGGGGITIGGNTLQVVVAGGSLYVKGDTQVWSTITGSKSSAAVFAGKWLKTTLDDQQFGTLSQIVDITKLVGNYTPQGAVTKEKPGTYKGRAAIGLRTAGASAGTLYVATTGKPYFLGVTASGGRSVSFDSFNTATLPTAPAGSVPLSQVETQAQKQAGSPTGG
jgi:hypothetical protein